MTPRPGGHAPGAAEPKLETAGRTGSQEPAREARESAPGVPATTVAGRLPAGEFTTLDGENGYRIHGYDRMPPFLINLPTDTDLWMFVSSAGGLTAGRRDPDGAIFPYETVDRLHDGHHHTGPVTLLRIERAGHANRLWEPFAPRTDDSGTIERSLFKNAVGNRLVFEETHHELGMTFRHGWAGSDDTGWVRTATLVNLRAGAVRVTLLDGLRNVLPSGAPLHLHQHASCLVDAYKRVDVDPRVPLAVYSLTARISDRPEPAEQLRATTVWCHGLEGPAIVLSLDALEAFRRNEPVRSEKLLTGRRGNFLVHAGATLDGHARLEWHIATDAGRSHGQIARLRGRLLARETLGEWIATSLEGATTNLARIVGSADGIQLTGSVGATTHHFANVLFNCLRGGVLVHGHDVPGADFAAFVAARDHHLAARHCAWLAALPAAVDVAELHRAAAETGDPGLRRLALEYVPLYFGRRHGDPSRPWNTFSICVRNADGSRALRYEGNWRDVFQNWEALTLSFPGFLPNVIAKFVNASTVDGFNPYRITRDGVDWEVLDPDNPWSAIGYWGDHQIVYLLRFLEAARTHFPGMLEEMLGEEIFSYADVPYRLAPYDAIVEHPRSTIGFDDVLAARIGQRVAVEGQDGKLVHDADGRVRHASFLEKLLVPVLAKLSNYVPEGGIWMNTERPEWNDANNALAGSGLSVVTMCHLRRHLRFIEELLDANHVGSARVSVEVTEWMRRVAGVLAAHRGTLESTRMGDMARCEIVDGLGRAFSDYRERVYAHGLSDKIMLEPGEVVALCSLACEHLDHSIRANRREDGLYHSYNVLERSSGVTQARVHPLAEMLEGQVAALSSGLVGALEATELLEGLFASRLYRPDQDSFLLYPVRELPTFLERNRVPDPAALAVPLLSALVAAGNASIIERDADGTLRFHADFGTSADVAAALDHVALQPGLAPAVARDREAVLELFVNVFGHRTFTGRSGTMYAYEGLGSVYWHMVSKLLLAVQELALRAQEDGEPQGVRDALADAYERVRGGLGFEKDVRAYGAFPTDPYSHTPAHAGAQQPGMTGQVKEEILTRFGELGVEVRDGLVAFRPRLLGADEFVEQPLPYRYFDLDGNERTLDVPATALAFTYCQVPVVYVLAKGEPRIRVEHADESTRTHAGDTLDSADSHSLLGRDGRIARIEVQVPEAALRASRERGR